jgi:hypothetical protein
LNLVAEPLRLAAQMSIAMCTGPSLSKILESDLTTEAAKDLLRTVTSFSLQKERPRAPDLLQFISSSQAAPEDARLTWEQLCSGNFVIKDGNREEVVSTLPPVREPFSNNMPLETQEESAFSAKKPGSKARPPPENATPFRYSTLSPPIQQSQGAASSRIPDGDVHFGQGSPHRGPTPRTHGISSKLLKRALSPTAPWPVGKKVAPGSVTSLSAGSMDLDSELEDLEDEIESNDENEQPPGNPQAIIRAYQPVTFFSSPLCFNFLFFVLFLGRPVVGRLMV